MSKVALWSSTFLLLCMTGTAVYASTTCTPDSYGTHCVSQVTFNTFAQVAIQSQQMQSQWCWAASISALFTYYGHTISQRRIVMDAYGTPQNIPGSGMVITQELNRDWVDDAGKPFRSEIVGLYDAQDGIVAVNNAQIIAELDQEHPVFVGARNHAVVATAIEYYKTLSDRTLAARCPVPCVVNIGVFDPWPGVGPRFLDPDELVPDVFGGTLRFVATIHVSDPPSPQTPPQPAPDGNGGGCTLGQAGSVDPTLVGIVLFALMSLWMRRRRP